LFMKSKVINTLIGAALLLSGCTGTPSSTDPTPDNTPAAVETPSSPEGTVTVITPTPSVYPNELPEDSAALVKSFGEVKLGSRAGDYLVYLTVKENVDIGFTKRGNPAFATGANSTSPAFGEDVAKILKENGEFTEPLKRVLEAYVNESYSVPEGEQDPLSHQAEFVEQVKAVQGSL